MILVRDVIDYLENLAPTALAASWDNVGLLMGDADRPVQRVMTCLTLTDETVEEARDQDAQLVVTHHPLPFRPLAKITADTVPGRLVWKLAAGQISVYSAHTAFDSAKRGINQRLAEGLDLVRVRPLQPADDDESIGTGRVGEYEQPISLGDLASRLKQFLELTQLDLVGQTDRAVARVAIGCGAADEFLKDAVEHACDALILGEARFHTALAAQAHQVGLLLPGHFASERFAMDRLACELGVVFPDLTIWCAERERDPLRRI